MDLTLLDQWLKLAQNLSFTGFLILCVGVLGYALYRLYLDVRTDWNQVQANTEDIAQLNQSIATLISKMDQLIGELHVTNPTSHTDITTTGTGPLASVTATLSATPPYTPTETSAAPTGAVKNS